MAIQFDIITSNANMIELMDLNYLLEETESSLNKFMDSDNYETSKIAKVLFHNLRKMHSDLTTRMVDTVTGHDENSQHKTKIVQKFDEKQFITQSYNIPAKQTKNKTN